MSKYNKLWEWLRDNDEDSCSLSYEEIESIAGIPLDHSFLSYKKELLSYGFCVVKISMKDRTVLFARQK